MKKINLLLSAFAILFFVACSDVEPIDPALLSKNNSSNNGGNNGGGSGGNTGGGGTGGGSSSSGDYWPTAINNQWTYEQNGSALSPNIIVGTDVFGGKTYYKFTQSSGSSGTTSGTITTWLNKESGVYRLKIDDISINAGGLAGVQTGYEMIMLKDNIPVGATWSGTYTQTTTYTGIPPIVTNVNYSGEILAKNVTEVVNGETFPNVIKLKFVLESSMSGSTSIQELEYWYAKDVGPIKTTGSGNNTILLDYILN